MGDTYNFVDEILGIDTECFSLKDFAEDQIQIIKDMFVLKNNDPREQLLLGVLLRCETELQIESTIRDLKMGIESLDAMLKRKEVM